MNGSMYGSMDGWWMDGFPQTWALFSIEPNTPYLYTTCKNWCKNRSGGAFTAPPTMIPFQRETSWVPPVAYNDQWHLHLKMMPKWRCTHVRRFFGGGQRPRVSYGELAVHLISRVFNILAMHKSRWYMIMHEAPSPQSQQNHQTIIVQHKIMTSSSSSSSGQFNTLKTRR